MPKVLSRQLTLLPPPKIWESRFSPALFRRIPTQPGVYLLGDGKGQLLYIGKATNLRRRLLSYKNLPLDRCSRKTARLVRQTKAISWEILPTPEAALLRENELLRLLKPKFNQLNTRPELYARIMLTISPTSTLALTWGRGHPPSQTATHWYGAFKGLRRLQLALQALLRLCIIITTRPDSLHQFPPPTYSEKIPSILALPAPLPPPLNTPQLWHDFFAGHRDLLILKLESALPPNLSLSLRRTAELDLERLRTFYISGPLRNQRLCQLAGLPGPWLAPEELDDLLALEQANAHAKSLSPLPFTA